MCHILVVIHIFFRSLRLSLTRVNRGGGGREGYICVGVYECAGAHVLK